MKIRSKQIAADGSQLLVVIASLLLVACGQTGAKRITAAPIPCATEQVINFDDSDTIAIAPGFDCEARGNSLSVISIYLGSVTL